MDSLRDILQDAPEAPPEEGKPDPKFGWKAEVYVADNSFSLTFDTEQEVRDFIRRVEKDLMISLEEENRFYWFRGSSVHTVYARRYERNDYEY